MQVSKFQGPAKSTMQHGYKKANIQGLLSLNKSKNKIINETIQEVSSRNLNASQSKAKLMSSDLKTFNQHASIGVRINHTIHL